MKNKYKILIAIAAILAVFFFWKSIASKKNGNTIQTARAETKSFSKIISSSGKTKAKLQADLKFQIGGKLSWIGISTNSEVKKGQIIAKLDSRDTEANLTKALRDYSKERNDFEETWRVTYKGISNPQTALTDTVKRILEKNQWDLDKAVKDVEIKSYAVELASITSPLDGIVITRDLPIAGTNITSATTIATIVDPNSLIFEASLDETDIGTLAVGHPAVVSLDAFPESTFSGTVTSISFASEVSGGGATIFPVEIALSATNLRSGLNGDVGITTKVYPQVLTIPTAAIKEDEKGTYVTVKTQNKYQKIYIKIGENNNNETIIISGLNNNDEVVIKGFASLPK